MLAAIALGLALGAALAPWLPAWPASLALPVLVAWVAGRSRRACDVPGSPAPRMTVRLAVGASLVLPMAWWTTWRAPGPAPDDAATFAPRRFVHVVGDVVDTPAGGESGWRADLAVVAVAGRPATGVVAARFPVTAPRPRPGERWGLAGRLGRPRGPPNPGGVVAPPPKSRAGVFATLGAAEGRPLGPAPGLPAAGARAVDDLRMRLLSGLAAGLPADRAALAGSLVLGGGAAPVPRTMADRFRDAGLAHLLAASGAQVALLGGLAFGAARALGAAPAPAAAATLPVLVLYLALTGAPAGMVRATVMGAIGLVGLALGRRNVPFAALWATTAVMLVAWPGCAHDLGFQFSVLATYALVRLSAGGAADRLPGPAWAWSAALAPVACWAWVTPWQAACFHTSSIAALPANWLATPLVLALTPWGLAVAAVGLVDIGAAAWLNQGTAWALAALVAIAEGAAGVPGQLVPVPDLGPTTLVLAYAALACGLARPRAAVACALVALLAAHPPGRPSTLAALAPAARPAYLEVAVLAVGQGDAIALRTPGGAWVVVDGGPAGPWGDAGQATVVPYLRHAGCRRVALMVASHAHGDHVGGLPAIGAAFPVDLAWEAGHEADGHGDRLLAAWLAAGIPWTSPPATLPALAWCRDGVSLTALPTSAEPASVNDGSLVLRLAYGATSMLLPGDLEAPGEAALLATAPAALRAQVLKVAHHGAAGSSTEAWLAAVAPGLAVISAGAGNVHGHPHAAALARLREAGAAIARTDESGAVLLRSDGHAWEWTTGDSAWRTWQPLPTRP